MFHGHFAYLATHIFYLHTNLITSKIFRFLHFSTFILCIKIWDDRIEKNKIKIKLYKNVDKCKGFDIIGSNIFS